jgi:hypothetical protein
MIQTFDTDVLQRFYLLASKLPAQGGKPVPVRCKECGLWFGLVANQAGVIIGHFAPDIRWKSDGLVSIATALVNTVLIDEKRLSLKCTTCGFVTRWRR